MLYTSTCQQKTRIQISYLFNIFLSFPLMQSKNTKDREFEFKLSLGTSMYLHMPPSLIFKTMKMKRRKRYVKGKGQRNREDKRFLKTGAVGRCSAGQVPFTCRLCELEALLCHFQALLCKLEALLCK